MELLQPHDSVRETTISDIPKSKIRQYSMYHENRLVGDQMRFRQLELVAQRERAQFEWRRRGQDHAADDKDEESDNYDDAHRMHIGTS